ncbi:MAG: hypothetical protein Q8916_01405 [Bacteroidota bacterium]|nr:hypothetical protein [Bacteroidota bacterium]MDP4229042.1 hypothetical protein [Bacteroidota bacterium]MDP4235433.1 hypothetical protein [Bacteroidota bacterium]
MSKLATFSGCLIFFLSTAFLHAQPYSALKSGEVTEPKLGVHIDFSAGDTTFLSKLIHGDLFQSPLQSIFARRDSTEDDFWSMPDSTDDSLLLDLKMGDFSHHKKKHNRTFLITAPPYEREIPHLESMPFMDFNRVNGFFLGIATPTMVDFGRHNEFGLKGGIGYGFEEKKGQSQLAGEYRIPLKSNDTSIPAEKWKLVPTLALGAEYHNVTTTDDAWRTERAENAVYAFLVREDFRDYYKIEGWDAYIAFRPEQKSELHVEYRSDIYYDEPQRVFHGRWGGSKNLPPNPAITTGRMNSWVITAVREDAHTEKIEGRNVFGDAVSYSRVTGRVYLLQAEFGNNTSADSNYQRYILDARDFNPICPGLSIDTRFRMESGTGDMPIQKMQYLGGPSSLPALKNKIIAGNRLALLNTEIRVSLVALSSIFENDNPELIILNDFGFCKRVPNDNNLLQGYGDMTFNSIAYNVGIGLGHPSGFDLGVSWRTDIKEAGRFFFRIQRPF